MYKSVTDFSGAYNKTISENAGMLRQTHKLNARRKDTDTVKVKLIDKFNFVTHVYFKTDENGVLQNCCCDGTTRYCGNGFCEHCKAAYDYLKDSGEFIVTLPDEAENDSDKTEEENTGDDDTEEHSTGGLEKCAISNVQCAMENDDIFSLYDDMTEDEENEDIKEPDEPFEPECMNIILGTDKNTGEPVVLMPNNTDQVLNNNIGIIGTMGTGKTQFTKSLVTQLYRSCRYNYDGTPLGILIFDYKGDYNESKPDFMEMTDARIIQPYRMPFNPLSLNLKENNNKALLPKHTANAFKDTISKIYNLGPKQEGVLFDCIMAAYEKQGIDPADRSTWKRPAPTFSMVYEQYRESQSFNDNDKLAVVMKKLEGFEIFSPDPLKALPLSKILKGVVVIDISDYDEDIQSLVVAITLDLFYAQMQTFGSSLTNGKYRQLKTFILVDEADNFMKMNFPSLRKIMKEGREFGAGIILSTQSLAHFCTGDDDYSKYIITWVIHNVNDLNRRDIEKVLGLAQKSTELEEIFLSIKELKKHESIVKISGGDPAVMDDKPFWKLYSEETGVN